MTATPPGTVQDEQREQLALALGAMLIPLFFVVMFAVCIIGTYHKPHPDGIKVGIVGPPQVTAALRVGAGERGRLGLRHQPGGDGRRGGPRRPPARPQRRLHPDAGPEAPGDPDRRQRQRPHRRDGGRNARPQVAAAQGDQLVMREVRPLPSGDEIGLGIFMFMVVCTICGYITPTVLETITPGLRPSRRYPIIAVTSLLVATIAYLIGGLGYGTYNGSFGTVLAFIGVGALYTLTIGLGTRLFQVLLGPPGIFASLAIFVFLNIPSLGATYTSQVLAPFWRFLNHFWVGAAAVNAERSILYFGGQGVGTDMIRLLVWTAGIVVLLLLPLSRKLERRRERSIGPGARAPPPPVPGRLEEAVCPRSRQDGTAYETLTVSAEGGGPVHGDLAPPMNLLGPELVRDLVSLIQRAEADEGVKVLVFKSADPDYFISHVDLNKVSEYRDEAAKLTGEASIALLFRYLSASPLVSVAQIEGRVSGAGSEFVLACDMRFAARGSAVFGQFEPSFGTIPGGGAAQHLTRLMGRGRALEVMLSAEDYDADLAERYGWINRALPAAEIDDFVRSLANRIAGFRLPARLWSRSESTRSHWRRWRTFVETPTCSVRECAPRKYRAQLRLQ